MGISHKPSRISGLSRMHIFSISHREELERDRFENYSVPTSKYDNQEYKPLKIDPYDY